MGKKLKDVDVYGMDMHEETSLGHGTFVLRVEGGWVYWRIYDDRAQGYVAGVFVPEPRR